MGIRFAGIGAFGLRDTRYTKIRESMEKFRYSIFFTEEDYERLDTLASFSHVPRSKMIRLLIQAGYATLENLESSSPGIKEHLAGFRVVNHVRGKREDKIPWLAPWFDVELLHKKITKWMMTYTVVQEPNLPRQLTINTDYPPLPPAAVLEKYITENNITAQDVLHVFMTKFFKKPQDALDYLIDMSSIRAQDLLEFFKDENLTKEDLVKAYANERQLYKIASDLENLYENKRKFLEDVIRIADIEPGALLNENQDRQEHQRERYNQVEQRYKPVYKNWFDELMWKIFPGE